MVTDPHQDIRGQILAAAERVIVDRGLRAATTRAIAEEAGCAEGSIYRYFPDKHALVIECIGTRYPEFVELVAGLPERVGSGSVRRTLEEVGMVALRFYRAILPMIGGSIAEPELLQAQRRHFTEKGGGPMRAINALSTYVRGEQRLGRISGKVSPESLARLFLGGVFGQAFLETLVGDGARLPDDETFVRDVVGTLLEGSLRKTPRAHGSLH